jgi:D-glycero-D-manno-heptose 1,7-bisphosphate phosphatase
MAASIGDGSLMKIGGQSADEPDSGSAASSPAAGPPPIRWVFLDRDGTINVKAPAHRYITSPDQLALLPGAAEAIQRLNAAGVWVGVVTNQRGVARGEMTEEDLQAVHLRLAQELAGGGAHLDAVYYCPHEQGTCSCRKPQPGLLLDAQRDHPGMRFAAAALIGDAPSDVQAGRRLGMTTILLAPDGASSDHDADHVAQTLLDAVHWLSRQRGLGPQGSST